MLKHAGVASQPAGWIAFTHHDVLVSPKEQPSAVHMITPTLHDLTEQFNVITLEDSPPTSAVAAPHPPAVQHYKDEAVMSGPHSSRESVKRRILFGEQPRPACLFC